MKKFLCLMLAVLMLTSCLAGCGADNAEPTEPPFEATAPSLPALNEGGSAEEILQARRDLVEQSMRNMCTIRWTPATTIEYSLVNKSQGLEADRVSNPTDIVTLYQGVIYEGIPYTHGSNSIHAFLEYATAESETGTLTLSNLETADFSGYGYQEPNRCARLGTDCADQVFWAWNNISSSISFEYCANMVPGNGCILVGDYTHNETKFAYTYPIAEANGMEVMFESYAKMLKGDAMVFINSKGAGHAIMNVEVHIVRNEDGTINGQESYAITLEQESGDERTQTDRYVDETTGETIVRLQGIDRKYTFQFLYQKGYLPVTCKELIDPAPLEAVTVTDSITEPSIDNIFKGKVTSNRRISYVTIDIADEKGNVVQSCTTHCISKEMYTFEMIRFVSDVEKLVQIGSIDLDALESGTYTVTHTATLSDGDEWVFRSFPYEK